MGYFFNQAKKHLENLKFNHGLLISCKLGKGFKAISYASTNEGEASEIAKEIVKALTEKDICVFYVTHLFEFANNLYRQNLENAIFLRTHKDQNGNRTYKIVEGSPLDTAFGKDLYIKIFQEAAN